jgi:hypothetical protein
MTMTWRLMEVGAGSRHIHIFWAHDLRVDKLDRDGH